MRNNSVTQQEDIQYIKGQILSKFPLLGVTMMSLPIVPDDRIGTAATDGQQIFYSPKFFSTLSDEQKQFVFAHEVMHVAFNHILRSKGRDQRLWNIATDSVINQILKNEQLPIIEGGVDIAEAVNHSAEEMYEKLLKKKEQRDQEKGQNQDTQKQSEQGQSQNQDGQKQSEQGQSENQDEQSQSEQGQSQNQDGQNQSEQGQSQNQDEQNQSEQGQSENQDGQNQSEQGQSENQDGQNQSEQGQSENQDVQNQSEQGQPQNQDGQSQSEQGQSQNQDGQKQSEQGQSQNQGGQNQFGQGQSQNQNGQDMPGQGQSQNQGGQNQFGQGQSHNQNNFSSQGEANQSDSNSEQLSDNQQGASHPQRGQSSRSDSGTGAENTDWDDSNIDWDNEDEHVGHDTHDIWKEAVKQAERAERQKQEQSEKKKQFDRAKEKINQQGTDENKEGTSQEKEVPAPKDEKMDAYEKGFVTENQKTRHEMAEQIRERLNREKESFRKSTDGTCFGDVGETQTPVVDWKKLLKKSFDEERDRWSYRRSSAENDYMARVEELEDEGRPDTEVMLDVSGSVNVRMLREFLRQLKPLLKSSKLKVGCFDEFVYEFKEIKTKEDIDNFKITASSQWTENWDAAVRAFSRKKEVNKIVFTDGYPCPGTMPEDDLKGKNVIWLVYGNEYFNPCCGKVIQVSKQQFLSYIHNAPFSRGGR